MSLVDALKAFETVQNRYADFGACDTEPRGVMADLLEQLHAGVDPVVGTSASWWQLFSDMPGVEQAAAALTTAAIDVVAAGKTDALGLARYARGGF